MINIQKAGQDIITLSIDDRERETNHLNERFLTHFETLVEEITRDNTIKGVVLTSSKKDFLLEHDLVTLSQMENSLSIYRYIIRLQKSIAMLEAWGKPVVAAISGSSYGAGLEIALACHHRIIINHHSISLGLSSPKLGLIPGLGTIQRLSKRLGLKEACSLLMKPEIYHPNQAWEVGLVDALADTKAQMLEMAHAWIEQNPEVGPYWQNSQTMEPLGLKISGEKRFLKEQSMRLYNETHGFSVAENRILERLHDGQFVSFSQACRGDALAFAELFSLPSSKNVIRTLYFGVQDCKTWARDKSTDLALQKRVAVIEPGVGAKELILALLGVGVAITIKEKDITSGEIFKNQIAKALQELVELDGLNKEAKDFQLTLIEVCDDLEHLKSCDLIVDCVGLKPENYHERTQLIDRVKKENAIVATTLLHSTLEEATIGLQSPQDWVALNIASLAHGSDTIEIKRSRKSSGIAIKSCLRMLHELDKIPIVINDQVDFFTDALTNVYIYEALLCLCEGLDPFFVERAALSAGMRVSPLKMADIIGFERILATLSLSQKETSLDKNENLEDKAIIQLLTTIKSQTTQALSKKDFTFYQDSWHLSQAVIEVAKLRIKAFDAPAKARGLIKQRLLYIQLTKALELIENKILQSPIEADVSSIRACQFPSHTGGILSFINFNGVHNTIEKYKELEACFGERFCPPRLLKQMASKKIDSVYELDQYFYSSRLEQET